MPYEWTQTTDKTGACDLRVWPHRSLSPQGFVTFIVITFGMLMVPLLSVLGTVVLWGLLPFLMGTLALMWAFLRRSYKDGTLTETLSLAPEKIALIRHNPRGPDQTWEANPYWVRVALHETEGPVENYLTLAGSGRTVELGAFLSPEERKALHDELQLRLARLSPAAP